MMLSREVVHWSWMEHLNGCKGFVDEEGLWQQLNSLRRS